MKHTIRYHCRECAAAARRHWVLALVILGGLGLGYVGACGDGAVSPTAPAPAPAPAEYAAEEPSARGGGSGLTAQSAMEPTSVTPIVTQQGGLSFCWWSPSGCQIGFGGNPSTSSVRGFAFQDSVFTGKYDDSIFYELEVESSNVTVRRWVTPFGIPSCRPNEGSVISGTFSIETGNRPLFCADFSGSTSGETATIKVTMSPSSTEWIRDENSYRREISVRMEADITAAEAERRTLIANEKKYIAEWKADINNDSYLLPADKRAQLKEADDALKARIDEINKMIDEQVKDMRSEQLPQLSTATRSGTLTFHVR